MTTKVIEPNTLLQDIKRARKADDTYHIWWLGGHGFLLKWRDRCLLTDPILSQQTNHPQGAQTAHMTNSEVESPVSPVDLNFIDITTITRPRDLLLDRATIRGIWTVSPAMRLIVPKATCPFVAEHLGIHPALPIGLEDGETVTFADIEITALSLDTAKGEQDLGQDFAYVYRFGQEFTCLHTSRIPKDDALVEQLRSLAVDIAILPIAEEADKNTHAIDFAKKIGAKQIIPHISNPVERDTGAVDTFAQQAAEANLPIHVLQIGQRWSNAR